jgi:hypothetical protein
VTRWAAERAVLLRRSRVENGSRSRTREPPCEASCEKRKRRRGGAVLAFWVFAGELVDVGECIVPTSGFTNQNKSRELPREIGFSWAEVS